MTWKKHANFDILVFQSKSTRASEISKDLLKVLEKLEVNSKDMLSKQILIYIDATNGNLICSKFSFATMEVYDEKACYLELMALWQELEDDGYSSLDFDVIVIKSIKKAFKTTIGKLLKSNFEVYYQDELDSPKRLRQNFTLF